MKNNLPSFHRKNISKLSSANRAKTRARLTWILAPILLAALAYGFSAWTQAQSANSARPAQSLRPDDEPEPPSTPARELAKLAILEPAAFENAVVRKKNPQELQAEQIAIFSIAQPNAYAAEFEPFKDNNRRQQEQAARAAILDPVGHSGPVRKQPKANGNAPTARP